MTVLLVVSFLFTSSVICASNESQARRRFWNVNCPRTSSHHLSVNSSFIHAFEELATEHYRLYIHIYSSCNDFDSLLAAPNTINGFSLVPFNLAAKQTKTWTFSCPVDFTRTSLVLVASTAVSEAISFQTAVSSIATILWGAKLYWFCNRHTCITKDTSWSIKYEGSFYAVVFCHNKNPWYLTNFSHHPLLATKVSLLAGSVVLSSKIFFALNIIIFRLTWSIFWRIL